MYMNGNLHNLIN